MGTIKYLNSIKYKDEILWYNKICGYLKNIMIS